MSLVTQLLESCLELQKEQGGSGREAEGKQAPRYDFENGLELADTLRHSSGRAQVAPSSLFTFFVLLLLLSTILSETRQPHRDKYYLYLI